MCVWRAGFQVLLILCVCLCSHVQLQQVFITCGEIKMLMRFASIKRHVLRLVVCWANTMAALNWFLLLASGAGPWSVYDFAQFSGYLDKYLKHSWVRDGVIGSFLADTDFLLSLRPYLLIFRF